MSYTIVTFVFFCFCLFVFDEQVHELFSKSGDVKRIIIGLDKVKKTACGFCFVEYPFKHETPITLKICVLIILIFMNMLSKHIMKLSQLSQAHVRQTDLNPSCSRYYIRADAEHAMRFINGTRLDDRIIRTDWDTGFKEGRQFGRGKSGGQVRNFTVTCCECL